MKKSYRVWMPFQGSIAVDVIAENEEQALIIGEEKLDAMTNDDIANNAEFDGIMVDLN